MSAEDRIRWDAIYRERDHLPYPDPDPLLFEYTPPVASESGLRALDLAAGMGQNGLWLASQGYTVDIMDISRVGLSRARGQMAIHQLRNVNLLQVDLDELELEEESYQAVCVFRYLNRDFFPQIKACVRPGGRVIYETYNFNYLELVPEFNKHFLLGPGELQGYFAGWQLLHAAETGHVTQMVVVKP